jgi:carboxylesterase type B
MESIISSYVTNEGGGFADSSVTDDEKFDELILRTYGNSSETAWIKDRAKQLWPPVSAPGSPYKTERERLGRHVSEGSFTCHNRLIADAYPGKVYTVHYAVPPAGHGSDQVGTFFNPASPQYASMSASEREGRAAFQSYLTSFARSGDPNKHKSEANTITWPLTTGIEGATLKNTLTVDNLSGRAGFRLADDELQVKERCKFWSDVQVSVEKALAKAS